MQRYKEIINYQTILQLFILWSRRGRGCRSDRLQTSRCISPCAYRSWMPEVSARAKWRKLILISGRKTFPPCGNTALFCGLGLKIAFQRLDIGFKSLSACVGDAADGARALALEGFLDLDIAYSLNISAALFGNLGKFS